MPNVEPRAAVIEIVEKCKSEDATGIIVPNEIRINGSPVLCPANDTVTIHEVSLSDKDAVKVTLTLWARRVEFKSEVTV